MVIWFPKSNPIEESNDSLTLRIHRSWLSHSLATLRFLRYFCNSQRLVAPQPRGGSPDGSDTAVGCSPIVITSFYFSLSYNMDVQGELNRWLPVLLVILGMLQTTNQTSCRSFFPWHGNTRTHSLGFHDMGSLVCVCWSQAFIFSFGRSLPSA